MGSRRRAREIALQILCTLDRQPDLRAEQALALYFQHLLGADLEAEADEPGAHGGAKPGRPLPPPRDVLLSEHRFAEELVCGVRSALAEMDGLLARSSRNWRLERMTLVDRNLLRLAGYELSHCPDTPARVVINEAIEVAKRYGTSESPAFVNGVLDRVLVELHRHD